jgi:DNA-binding LytR/AlgR family response regulator
VVNVNHIAGLTRNYRGQLEVRLKGRPDLLAVSDAYARRFKQM